MILKRIASKESGVFGVLLYKGTPFALTLENPDLNNKPFESCIPAGAYKCERYQSKRFGDTFMVMDVFNRLGILFHWGNTREDTKGCILIGEMFEPVYGKDAIQSSRKGFAEFKQLLAEVDEFDLLIKEHYN